MLASEEQENLKFLFLDSTAISDLGIGNLSRLRNLQVLDLGQTDVTDVGVAKLKPLAGLHRLDLGGALATEEARKVFKHAEHLDITGLRTKADLLNLDNPADVAALRAAGLWSDTNDLRNVTRIDARESDGSPGDWLPKLKTLHSLTVLQLPSETTDGDLIRVSELKSLRTLEIDEAGITDAGTKDIGRLTELKELSFNYCQGLGDVTVERLLPLAKLETLTLSYSGVTDAGLKHLAALRTLKKLGLWSTKITDAGLASLANLGSLEQLDLDGTQVSNSCLVHLARLKKLSYLSINQTAITDAGVDRIRKAMPRLKVWPDHPNQ